MNFSDQIRVEMKWCAEFDRQQCLDSFYEISQDITEERDTENNSAILIALLHRLVHVTRQPNAPASPSIALAIDGDKAISVNSSKAVSSKALSVESVSVKQLSLISDIAENDPLLKEFDQDFHRLSITAKEVVIRWNSIFSLPRVSTLRGRVVTLNRATRSAYFRLKWDEGFQKMLSSTFLSGKGKKGWKPTIDWFIAPTNLENIIEGKYDDKRSKPPKERNYDREEI